MLLFLAIRQYAVVDALDIEHASGLTVVTGETGAGKSILVDALALALGDRAEAGIVRPGAERAEVTASFDVSQLPAAREWLTGRELSAPAGDCILRRTIGTDGRSRAYINGTPSTLADLKSLGGLLVDIHGQHEHQSLLRRDAQRGLLDDFGGLGDLAREVKQAHRRLRERQESLADLLRVAADGDARRELLRFQLEEFARLALREGEYEALEDEQRRLANVDALRQACESARDVLGEGEGATARERLERARSLLGGQTDPELARATELVVSAIVQADEATDALRRYADRLEADPQRLAEVEQRLSGCFQLARKHRVTPSELPALQARLAENLDRIEHHDSHREALDREVRKLRDDFAAVAGRLGKARREAALRFEHAVGEQLGLLGMTGGRLEIAVIPLAVETAPAHGLEEIEFRVSLNAGQPAKPLAKVASGGELSRISLAIQVVGAEKGEVPTLVFDEVDVGIGGATAEVVGRLLRRLGERGQVLCVTHLAQVAACGHRHLRVEKHSDGKQVRSAVRVLDANERVQEIARMAGGLNVTPEALRHAEAMLAAR